MLPRKFKKAPPERKRPLPLFGVFALVSGLATLGLTVFPLRSDIAYMQRADVPYELTSAGIVLILLAGFLGGAACFAITALILSHTWIRNAWIIAIGLAGSLASWLPWYLTYGSLLALMADSLIFQSK